MFQKNQGIPKLKEGNSHTISTNPLQSFLTWDKVYSIVRKSYDRGPTDEVDDLNVNASIWRMFMNTTLQAAVHLGQDDDQNLANHVWTSLK